MINPIGPNYTPTQLNQTTGKTIQKVVTTNDETGVTLEIGEKPQESAVYKKPVVQKPDAKEIEKLWDETDKATSSLRTLVENLISRQGKKVEDVLKGKVDLKVDKEAKADAEQLISEDGEFGVKQTAQRIVDFAKSLAGEDKSKIAELRDAIKQGFEEAAKVLGKLPDISQKTYDEVMKQLDEWEKG